MRLIALLAAAAVAVSAGEVDPCKRQPFRGRCPTKNGGAQTRSQFVLRYYMRDGECVSYPYGHCANDDSEPRLFRYKEECEDACVKGPGNLGTPKEEVKEEVAPVRVEQTTASSTPSTSTATSTTTEAAPSTTTAQTTPAPRTECERRRQQASSRLVRGGFVPVCTPDGRFERTQCEPDGQQCFCVDQRGIELVNSRMHGKPDCASIASAAPPRTNECVGEAAQGPCSSSIQRWHYEESSQTCKPFIYSGCGGNGNNYPNEKACHDRCAPPPAGLPKCAKGEPLKTVSGAPINCAKRDCPSGYECSVVQGASVCCPQGEKTVGALESGKPADICQLPKERGPCDHYELRFYYNPEANECKYFFYGGCEGNSNNFEKVEECEQRCNVTKGPRWGGHAHGSLNPTQPESAPTPVRISTANTHAAPTTASPTTTTPRTSPRTAATTTEYQRAPTRLPETRQRFQQPPQPSQQHHVQQEAREQESRQQQVQQRPEDHAQPQAPLQNVFQLPSHQQQPDPMTLENNRCKHPRDAGTCRGQFVRWFFDTEASKCDVFTYSGCAGNGNNFATKEECLLACADEGTPKVETSMGTSMDAPDVLTTASNVETTNDGEVAPEVSNVCLQDVDAGECNGVFQRFAFDGENGECRAFTYGGCGGNGNNFASIDDCVHKCGNVKITKPAHPVLIPQSETVTTPAPIPPSINVCDHPVDKGPCGGFFQRYAFDQITGDCLQFSYGGCGGNGNNFATRDDCHKACLDRPKTSPAPEETTPVIRCPPAPRCQTPCTLQRDTHGCITCNCDSQSRLPPAPVPREDRPSCPPVDLQKCVEPCIIFQNRKGCQECVCPLPADPNSLPTTRHFAPVATNSFRNVQPPAPQAALPPAPRRPLAPQPPAPAAPPAPRVNSVPNVATFEKRPLAELEHPTVAPLAPPPRVETHSIPHPPAPTTARSDSQTTRRPFESPLQLGEKCMQKVDAGPCQHFVDRFYFNSEDGMCHPFKYGGCAGNRNHFFTMRECEIHCARFGRFVISTDGITEGVHVSPPPVPVRISRPPTSSVDTSKYLTPPKRVVAFGENTVDVDEPISLTTLEKLAATTSMETSTEVTEPHPPGTASFKPHPPSPSAPSQPVGIRIATSTTTRSTSTTSTTTISTTTSAATTTTTSPSTTPSTTLRTTATMPTTASSTAEDSNVTENVTEEAVTSTMGTSSSVEEEETTTPVDEDTSSTHAQPTASTTIEPSATEEIESAETKMETAADDDAEEKLASAENSMEHERIDMPPPPTAVEPDHVSDISTTSSTESSTEVSNESTAVPISEVSTTEVSTTEAPLAESAETTSSLPEETHMTRVKILPKRPHTTAPSSPPPPPPSPTTSVPSTTFSVEVTTENESSERRPVVANGARTQTGIRVPNVDDAENNDESDKKAEVMQPTRINESVANAQPAGTDVPRATQPTTQSTPPSTTTVTTTTAKPVPVEPSSAGREPIPQQPMGIGRSMQSVELDGDDEEKSTDSTPPQRPATAATRPPAPLLRPVPFVPPARPTQEHLNAVVVCAMPPDAGRCTNYVPRWFFNAETGQCEQFSYGSCGGNANNFMDRTTCELRCLSMHRPTNVLSQVPERCALDKDAGLGGGYNVLWYFNMKNLRCEQFIYQGHGGNANQFQTLTDCERYCTPQPGTVFVRPSDGGASQAAVNVRPPPVPTVQQRPPVQSGQPAPEVQPPLVSSPATEPQPPSPPTPPTTVPTTEQPTPAPTQAPTKPTTQQPAQQPSTPLAQPPLVAPKSTSRAVSKESAEQFDKEYDGGEEEEEGTKVTLAPIPDKIKSFEKIDENEIGPLGPVVSGDVGSAQAPGFEARPPAAAHSEKTVTVAKPQPLPTTSSQSSSESYKAEPLPNIKDAAIIGPNANQPVVAPSPPETVNYQSGKRTKALGAANLGDLNAIDVDKFDLPDDNDGPEETVEGGQPPVPACPNGLQAHRYVDGRPVQCLPGRNQCPADSVCYFNGLDYFCCPTVDDPYDKHIFGGYNGDEVKVGYKVFGPLAIRRLKDEPLTRRKRAMVSRSKRQTTFSMDDIVMPLRFDAEKPRQFASASAVIMSGVRRRKQPRTYVPKETGSPIGDLSMCLQPLSAGDCSAEHTRYYYDRDTNVCRVFTYTGCKGNANNFGSLSDCQRLCVIGVEAVPEPVEDDSSIPAGECPGGAMPLGGKAPVLCGNSTDSIGCPAGYFCRTGPPDVCCPRSSVAKVSLESVLAARGDVRFAPQDLETVDLVPTTSTTTEAPTTTKDRSFLAVPEFICPDASDPLYGKNGKPLLCGAGFDGVKMCPRGYYCAIDSGKGTRLCCPLLGIGSRIPNEQVEAPYFGRRRANPGEVIERGSLPSDAQRFEEQRGKPAAQEYDDQEDQEEDVPEVTVQETRLASAKAVNQATEAPRPTPSSTEAPNAAEYEGDDDEEEEEEEKTGQFAKLKLKPENPHLKMQEQAAAHDANVATPESEASDGGVNIDIQTETSNIDAEEPMLTKQADDKSLCHLTPSVGRACREDEPAPRTNLHYFYSAKDKRCKLYFYKGCGGNGNRFEKKAHCETACAGLA